MQTLALIKPHIAKNKNVSGQVIQAVLTRGFTIHRRREFTLTKEQAEAFYAEHAGRPYFEPLILSITSGPLIALTLEHETHPEQTITLWRTAMGATDSSKAEPGTLRYTFGNPHIVRENAVHGSDSETNAQREIALIFGDNT